MTQSDLELNLDLGAETIHCTEQELATALAGVLREMRAAAPFVTPNEREILRLIMSHPAGTLTVGDLFPTFDRDALALTALRRLRTAQFIRPADRDRWEAGERIEIKPFARLIWDRLGEAAIFGDAPEAQPADPAEDIDLSLPDVNEVDEGGTVRMNEEDDGGTVRMAEKTKTGWDEADVLEFLNDESVDTPKSSGSLPPRATAAG
jgi:hypothetical protein